MIESLFPERKTRKFKEPSQFKMARSEKPYFLLPFKFHRINDDREILVNEIGDFLLVPSGTAEKIVTREISMEKDEELYEDLLSNFFISETPIPELMVVLETRYRTKKSFLDYFTALHIFVITLRCEHTCHYCQVSRVTENRDAFDMSRQHIDEGISLMMQSPNLYITMEFQGGEALLAFDNIVYAVLAAKKAAELNGKKITFVICSNLAPITEEILMFCKEHQILISTSLDGPDFIHNKNRHRAGRDSYQKAILGIDMCQKTLGKDNVSALLTTTNLSLDFPFEIVDEYVNRGFTDIFLRPISPYGFATQNANKNHYQIERFLEFYKTALSRIIEYNNKGYFLRESYTTIILRKMLTPFPVGYVDLQSPAGMITNVIVFNYDGKVYASDEARMLAEMKDYTFLLGELEKNSYNEIFYGEKAKAFSEVMTNESLAGCSECAFQSFCGADPVLHYATQGDSYGYRPTSVFCQKNMEVIRYVVELMDKDKSIEKIFRSWILGRTI